MDALAMHSAVVVRLADEHGLNLRRALGSVYSGWSRAENGAVGEGAAMIRDGIAKYRAGGSALSLPLYLVSLASLEGTLGNQSEALKLSWRHARQTRKDLSVVQRGFYAA